MLSAKTWERTLPRTIRTRMDISATQFFTVMLMTLIAGLATGIGGAVAFFRLPRHESGRFLSAMLGFSGGVMVYISLVELMGQARTLLGESFGAPRGGLIAVGAFAFGMLVTALIDKLVPEVENPHHVRTLQEFNHAEHATADERARLGRAGLLFTLAIGLHNFPEGLATLAAGLSAPEVGWPVTVAIALHNIPEGVAIAVPLVYATGNRRKAFGASVLAGLAEPAGALIGFLVLLPVLSPAVLAALFALVAGVMVYITFDELLPMAETYGKHHIALGGLIAGMLVIGAGMELFH